MTRQREKDPVLKDSINRIKELSSKELHLNTVHFLISLKKSYMNNVRFFFKFAFFPFEYRASFFIFAFFPFEYRAFFLTIFFFMHNFSFEKFSLHFLKSLLQANVRAWCGQPNICQQCADISLLFKVV